MTVEIERYENDFARLAERVLHTLILSGALKNTDKRALRKATDLSVTIAESFTQSFSKWRTKKRSASIITPAEWELIDSGKIIGAIREVRARTGLSIKEAKAVVDQAKVMSAVDRLAMLQEEEREWQKSP